LLNSPAASENENVITVQPPADIQAQIAELKREYLTDPIVVLSPIPDRGAGQLKNLRIRDDAPTARPSNSPRLIPRPEKSEFNLVAAMRLEKNRNKYNQLRVGDTNSWNPLLNHH